MVHQKGVASKKGFLSGTSLLRAGPEYLPGSGQDCGSAGSNEEEEDLDWLHFSRPGTGAPERTIPDQVSFSNSLTLLSARIRNRIRAILNLSAPKNFSAAKFPFRDRALCASAAAIWQNRRLTSAMRNSQMPENRTLPLPGEYRGTYRFVP
jgi:hypothetical protein